jgi:alkanesulfonate monooxygenase SsuD/methylene tetrahydromethanopterin reductase-like flavin-dependent oxidoreductase (luciferase family)
MRLSVWPSAAQPWSEILVTARHAAATGWDGVWIADHFMADAAGPTPLDTPVLEAGTLVAALGASVDRVRIGTLVYGNTYRHPAVVANMAVTADHVSGGRFVLGLGAGWQVNEHEQYGIDLPPPGERVERLAEAVAVIRSLLTRPTTTFEGRHYRLTDALCEPKPIQERLPILLGASGDRMLGVVARHADIWNTWGLPDHIAERSAALTRHCEAAGRDPDEVARTAQALVFFTDDEGEAERRTAASAMPVIAGTPERMRDVLAAYAEAGLDELIVPDRTFGTGEAKRAGLDRFAEDVAAAFR